ncbi:MAG: hypothetical protein JOS17DRAFT_449795 [Linnemannia elongata]|nr:MAG: hypothetical protein JOS17DRAFT_449795 [Linnemannia elongata]
MTTIQHPSLGYTPWHPYPYAPYAVPPILYPSFYSYPSYLHPSLYLHPPSYPHPSYPYPSYPHPSYLYPPYLRSSYPEPPYQQQHITCRGSHPSPHHEPISSQPTCQIRPQLFHTPYSLPTSLSHPAQEPQSNAATPPPPPYHPQDPLSLASPPRLQDPLYLASLHYPQDLQSISMGYKMLPDRGELTVRAAWDEFHGPLSHLRSQGWFSIDPKTKKA